MNLLYLWHRVADRHDWQLHVTPDELALRCPTCGAHSEGWKLDNRRSLMRRVERPPMRALGTRKSA
jgi:hypothetical protein